MEKQLIFLYFVLSLSFLHVSAIDILFKTSDSEVIMKDDAKAKLVDRTVRIDPLDGFMKYRGGYDLRNKHYWSSAAFSGIFGYALAVLWIIFGVGVMGIYLIRKFWKRNQRNMKNKPLRLKHCSSLHLVLTCLCTFVAIAASGLVLGGNERINSTTSRIIDIIIDVVNEASVTMHNSSVSLIGMRDSVHIIGGESKVTNFLTSASLELNSRASETARQAAINRRLVHKGLKIVYITTIVMASFTLFVVASVQVFGILKLHKAVQILVAACWILGSIFWIFFGISFFLLNFAVDTCTALQSFKENPYHNSLSSILPCEDLLAVEPILNDITGEIYDTINKVDQKISKSYGNIIQICNPLSPPAPYEYRPSQCSNSSITISEIPQVLTQVACPESENENEVCNGGIPVPDKYFYAAKTYAKSIQQFLDVYPEMQSLVQCETAENAFNEILKKHCNPLKRALRIMCGSLVILSLALMALALAWMIGDQKQKASDSSVEPNLQQVNDDFQQKLDVG